MSYTSTSTRTLPHLGKVTIQSHLAEDGSTYIELTTHVGTENAKTSRLDIPAGLLENVYSDARRLSYMMCSRPGSTEHFVTSLTEDDEDPDLEDCRP